MAAWRPDPRALARRLEVRNFAWVAAAYLTLVTLPVLLEVYGDCALYYDLGIYVEGMRKLSAATPNPWVASRGIYLFADHFDPIAWIAAPLAKLGPPPYGAVVFEALAMLAAVVPLFVAAGAGRLAQRTACLLALLTLFNAGAITAVHYPVHPTTWATAPMAALVLALDAKRHTLAVVWFALLLACKEEFLFVGLPLAWLLWRAGGRRQAVWTLALAVAWAAVAFGLRPLVAGPTEPYWRVPFVGLGTHPWAYARERLTTPDLRLRLGLFALPLAPLTAWLAWRHRRGPNAAYFTLAGPPMALRVLAMRWYHQYHAVTVGAATLAFVPALGRREVPRFLVLVTVATLVAANFRVVGSAYGLVRTGTASQYPYCPLHRGRLDALARARALLHADPEARMLVGQNLLPKLVDLPNARLLAEFEHPPVPPYRYVLVEVPPLGKTWPLGDKRVEACIARFRAQPGTEVLVDEAGVFLARGSFDD